MFWRKLELSSAIFVVLMHSLVFGSFVFFSKQSEHFITEATPISVCFESKEIKPSKKQEPKQPKQPIPIAPKNTVSTQTVAVPDIVKPQIEEKQVEKQPAIIPPDFNANYLHNPKPKYPLASRKSSEEGKVILRVFVSEDGAAKKVELKNSCGFVRLDESAIEAVKEWKFVPAKKGNENIAGWVVVPITFKLGA